MAFGAMPVNGLFPIVCIVGQVTADTAAPGTVTVPIKCRIHGVQGQAHSLFGGTSPTDLDLAVKNTTKSETIVTAMAVVDSSALASIATTAISGTEDLDAGDEIEIESDITGGATSPGVNGVAVTLWCSPAA